MWKNVLNWIKNINSNDPVYKCRVYKNKGCSHIDGYLCNIKTCNILEDYKIRELEQQLDIPLKDRIEKLSTE